MTEIKFNSSNLDLSARHLGNGKIEIFTVWPDGSEKDLSDYKVKIYELTPVNDELVLTRVHLKLKPHADGGLDIEDIN